MEDPRETLTTNVSTAELERRWNAVREIMRDKNLDYLLIRNDEEFLGGNVRWFTDIPARHSYPYTVVFPVDDEMTLVTPGNFPPGEPAPPKWAVRGVKQRFSSPYFVSVHYNGTYEAELVAGVLKEKKGATIGLVGKSYFPVNYCEYLWKHLPDSKFIDATEEIDQIKVIKSPEEIELIKGTAVLQDKAMEHVRKSIRPGRRDFEIYAEAHYSTSMQDSERGLILIGSGPPGSATIFRNRRFQNRVIREGDQVTVLIETNGPGGLYTELGRVFTVGEPSQELVDAFNTALEAQKLTCDLLKPGADPKDIWDANNEFLEKRGYAPERRLYAHGQGYDLVERPLIRFDEPMKIKEGMNLTVHPTAANKTVWAGITDNYLVEQNGLGECLHKTTKEIIVV